MTYSQIKIIALLLLHFTTANADCYLESKSKSTVTGTVDAILNAKLTITGSKNGERLCTAVFNAKVKGKIYKTTGKFQYEQSSTDNLTACRSAIEAGKRNIIAILSKTIIQSEAVLVCSEGKLVNPVARHLTIGQIVKMDNITLNPSRNTFTYKGTRCAYYISTEVDGDDLYQWQGVVCKVGNNWRVIDKY